MLLIVAIRILGDILQVENFDDSLSNVLVDNPGEELLNLGDGIFDLLLSGIFAKSINGLCEDLISSFEDILNSLVNLLVYLMGFRLPDTVDVGDMVDSLLEVLEDDVLDSLLNLLVELDDSSGSGILASRLDGLVDGLADTVVDVVLSLRNVLVNLGSVDLYHLITVTDKSRALGIVAVLVRMLLVANRRILLILLLLMAGLLLPELLKSDMDISIFVIVVLV